MHLNASNGFLWIQDFNDSIWGSGQGESTYLQGVYAFMQVRSCERWGMVFLSDPSLCSILSTPLVGKGTFMLGVHGSCTLKKKKINISKREKLQIYNPPLCKIRNKTKASPLRVQFKSATHRIRKSFYFLHENQQQSSPRQEYGLERTGTQHLWHGLWDSRDGSQALLIVKILRTSTKGRQNKRKGVW